MDVPINAHQLAVATAQIQSGKDEIGLPDVLNLLGQIPAIVESHVTAASRDRSAALTQWNGNRPAGRGHQSHLQVIRELQFEHASCLSTVRASRSPTATVENRHHTFKPLAHTFT